VAICVVRKKDGAVIVRAEKDEQVIRLEGNFYLHPEVVDSSILAVTSRLYDCPKKGVCHWIDLKTDKGFVTDVAWVYPETKEGFEHIAGWIGFYPDHRYYKTGVCEE
jgi:uncharacterized protein (DUF427 family)